MSRVIKFRGWTGEKMIPVAQIDFRYPKPLVLNNDEPNYVNKETGQWELMQFTGLFDKNGKEIYEWDIVKQVVNGVEPILDTEADEDKNLFYGYDPSVGVPDKIIIEKVDISEFGVHPFNNELSTYDNKSDKWEVIGNIYESNHLRSQHDQA